MNDPETLAARPDPGPPPPGRRLGWLWPAIRLVQVRARFLVVLAVIGLVVGQWERLAGYWNALARQAVGQADRASAVSSDTEFFCPMDPGVISPWEDKCPICNMALVRRKKGDAQLLPEGVVARMQVSPYRLQLAGVKTAPVEYRPLVHEILAMGFVRQASAGDIAADATETAAPPVVQVQIAQRDVPFVSLGQPAEARLSLPEAPPAAACLVALHPRTDSRSGGVLAEFRLDAPSLAWRPGVLASILIHTPLAEIEPYRSLSREPPALRPAERRTAYVSREHPEIVRDRPGRCPIDKTELLAVELAGNQRLGWWCPMHPEVVADTDGHECRLCNGMKLLPRIVSYAPAGHVLAVPASAVLDTGRRQLVYVEVAPGRLEVWQVRLGTRAGDHYPVLAGLAADNRVVGSGAFLLDAETRLSGQQASAAYFGAAAAQPHP